MNPKYWVTMGANLEKQVKNEQPRCVCCGQFLSSEEIINDDVVLTKYIPDSDITTEQIWYEHKQCSK